MLKYGYKTSSFQFYSYTISKKPKTRNSVEHSTLSPPAATGKHLIHMSPPLSPGEEPQMSSSATSTSMCNSHTCRWRPYSNANSFEANAAMVLIIVFCALICSLALNIAIRCFLRGRSSGRSRQLPLTRQDLEQRKPVAETAAGRMAEAPTLVYSTRMKFVGAEAECAICLSGFVEGEAIQVLTKCRHGFHVQCIQTWLSSHTSCPTCRSSCLPPSPPPEETSDDQSVDNVSQPVIPEQGR